MVVPSIEMPSVAQMWHKMPNLRAFVAKASRKQSSARPSTFSWRKSSIPHVVKRFSRASSYLGTVSIKPRYRHSSIGTPSFVSELQKTTKRDEFQVLDVLGRGTFGTVRLARHLGTGRTVAMKIVPLKVILECQQETNIGREQRVHLGLEHPFIATLYATFQDTKAVYFILEFCPGGEVYRLVNPYTDGHVEENDEDESDEETTWKLRQLQAEEQHDTSQTRTIDSESEDELPRSRNGRPSLPPMGRNSAVLENVFAKQKLRSSYGGLAERHVAFYGACVVLTLEYLHDRGILYRDLKLENLMLDHQGYPKLIDFGLSKPNAIDQTPKRHGTMCGSPEYMAPEILQHQTYDERVDLWSFGILLYEMLFGTTPFHHPNHREQSRRILHDQIEFLSDYEQTHSSVCSLIRTLLEKDPADRLASFSQVRTSSFFGTYFPSRQSWQQVEARERQAPFVPRLTGPFDTSLCAVVSDDDEERNDGAKMEFNF